LSFKKVIQEMLLKEMQQGKKSSLNMQETMQLIDLYVQIAHAKPNNVVVVRLHLIIWE